MAGSSKSQGFSACKYDVFISFRGKDTRPNFTSHLYAALTNKKVQTYKDDVSLPKGEEISPALYKAIKDSKISIVVFSRNYAASRWCLDELVHILKCKKERGQVVLPIFYEVDPSHVRKQKGCYGKAFVKHEKRFKDEPEKVLLWRSALEEAGSLSGWDPHDRNESQFVNEIVEKTIAELNRSTSAHGELQNTTLVGIDERLEKIESLLCINSPDVRIIGIWGMGGIGKSTLAQVAQKRFSFKFESCYYADVSDEVKRQGLHYWKKEFLAALLKDWNMDMNSSFIEARLRRTKVLVVLDNIDELECLIRDHVLQHIISQFGAGSRVVLTSRDKKWLEEMTDYIYKVDALNSDEAVLLFNKNAFKIDSSKVIDDKGISNRVVAYCGGNPLALTVLGSYLHKRSFKEWESALSQLKKGPDEKIQKVLRISYDALDRVKRSIFLDVACFLKGERREFVEKILGSESHIGINVLIEKCLMINECGVLRMHGLVQEMGWEVVRGESVELRQRSRLWIAQDIYSVLKRNKGSANIEGIFLDLSKTGQDLVLSPKFFKVMENLRLLKIYSGHHGDKKAIYLHKGLKYLPDSLRYLYRDMFPLKSLPPNFEPQNLVSLRMQGSNLEKLWDGVMHLGNLEDLDLRSSSLMELPDLSQTPKLESLDLSGCSNLRRFPKISRSLKYLYLNTSGIEEFDSSFESLENLHHLNLSDCRGLKSVPKLPRSLTALELSKNSLDRIPRSIKHMSNLKFLNLDDCKNLESVQDLPSSVEFLSASGCVSLKTIDARGCTSLHGLSASECTSLTEIFFDEHVFVQFDKIPIPIPQWFSSATPLTHCFSFGCCPNLEQSRRDSNRTQFERIPNLNGAYACYIGNEIPKHQSEGSQLTRNGSFFSMAVVTAIEGTISSTGNRSTILFSSGNWIVKATLNCDAGRIGDRVSIFRSCFNHPPTDGFVKLQIRTSSSDFEINKCGVYLKPAVSEKRFGIYINQNVV